MPLTGLSSLSAWRLRELIAAGDLSAVEVVRHVLAQIEERDTTLQSFAAVDRDGALAQAARAERAQLAREELGPLHGVPVGVKEHIPVAGLPTTGSIGGRGGAIATEDDVGVARLRRAGAVIVGTNAMIGTGNATWPTAETWQTFAWTREARNPWSIDRVAGASSSGSAAAVAGGLVPLSIGSDGSGSTRLPAAFCGVVGIHPSIGRIPHVDYVNPRLLLTSTLGPIARDVRDVAIALRAMSGPDWRDLGCRQEPPEPYDSLLDVGLDGVSFAWSDDLGYGHSYELPETAAVLATVRSEAHRLERVGAHVRDVGARWEDPQVHLGVLERAFPNWPSDVERSPPSADEYRNSVEARAATIRSFDALLRDYDAVLCPTTPGVAPTLEEWKSAWTPSPASSSRPTASHYFCYTAMFNWIGWPAISVPCGVVGGLPVGLQIAGRPGSEALLLRTAKAISAGAHASGTGSR